MALGYLIGFDTGVSTTEMRLSQRIEPPAPSRKPVDTAKADEAPAPMKPKPVTVTELPSEPEPDVATPATPVYEETHSPSVLQEPEATAALPPSMTDPASATWLRHAVPVALPADRPMIAIVIDDMGVDRGRSRRAAALPGPLTLSYLPYASDLPAQTAAAHAQGHELMLHMPMQPRSDSIDAGPNVLHVGTPPAQIETQLESALARFDGYVGINNHMGSRFTTDRAGMDAVMHVLHRHGLLFLDSRTHAATVGIAAAEAAGVPHAARHVFLDHEMTDEFVAAQLAELERIARSQGFAIGIGHPHDVTLDALSAWLPQAAERGFVLVPVSAIVRERLRVAGGGAGRAG
jgi:hypothetical protein